MTSLNQISTKYFERLFITKNNKSDERKPRVLLVDKHTTSILSLSYTQSQLLEHDIILIELITNHQNLKQMKNLDCIVYIKPTTDSINHLIKELSQPHYSKYQVYFNNIITKQNLEKIAELDDLEVIVRVMELFQDYQVINDNLYQLENDRDDIIDESNQLVSLLLALKKCPIIFYETKLNIELRKLGSEILYQINLNSNNNLFDDVNSNLDTPPVLLILDRDNDPITPLIYPWTYQSMIHEFIGIENNTIALAADANGAAAPAAVTLSDKFYQLSIYLNYGDINDKFQTYVEQYKKETKQTSVINNNNLQDLKKLLTKFPEFKKLSNNILKHLNILTKLDEQINHQNLWEIGELQQIIIGNLENYPLIKKKILPIINNLRIYTIDKVKLLILLMVRFPNQQNDFNQWINQLNDPTYTQPPITKSQHLLLESFKLKKLFPHYNFEASLSDQSNSNEEGGIGGGSNFFNKAKINTLFGGNHSNKSENNDNIYMQYTPRLKSVLANILHHQSVQSSSQFTKLVPDKVNNQYGNYDGAIKDIIIYFKGGITYEESRIVYELQQKYPSVNLIIGGDKIINSNDWLNILYDKVNDLPQSGNNNQVLDLL